jgi:rubrerythrin
MHGGGKPGPRMNASQILRSAARIESMARDLYADLAVTFTHHPFLRELFEVLAQEEAQHAMRIRLLGRHHGRAPWSDQDLERFQRELDGMVKELEAVREMASAAAGARNVRGLLRRLTAMEARFGSIHAEELARSAAPEVQKLFASLATQDARHSEMIEKAQVLAMV